MKKNIANQKWVVFAFNVTTNLPVTGDAANITANLRIDGAGANAVDDTNPAELEDGFYVFDLTQAETNGDNIAIAPASSTENVQVVGCPKAVWTLDLATPEDMADAVKSDPPAVTLGADAVSAAALSAAASAEIVAAINAAKPEVTALATLTEENITDIANAVVAGMGNVGGGGLQNDYSYLWKK